MSAGPATMSLLREFVFSNCGCGGSGATETLRTAYTGSHLDDAAWMSVPCEQPACVALRKMTPATLEAMDAAAEVMNGPAPETNYEEALDGSLILHADAAWGGPAVRVALSREEEDLLLRVLLERRIQRRKEAADHA